MSSFVHTFFSLSQKNPQHPMMIPLSAEVDMILLLFHMLLVMTRQTWAVHAKVFKNKARKTIYSP